MTSDEEPRRTGARPPTRRAGTADTATQTRRGFLAAAGVGLCAALGGCTAAADVDEGNGGHDIEAARPTAYIVREHVAAVGDESADVGVVVPSAAYERARAADGGLGSVVAAARDSELCAQVTARLCGRAEDRAAALRGAQSLTATIEYASDRATTGRPEYVRHPVETLVDDRGDCDDKAVLLAGLLAAPPLSCRVGLVFPADHCATLVARADLPEAVLAPDPSTVVLGGTTFVYVEAVGAEPFGADAEDYAERPTPVAYREGWHVLDPGALVGMADHLLEPRRRRGLAELL